MNKIKRTQGTVELRFQPIGAFRDWMDFDAPIFRFISDNDNGHKETAITLFGLGFVIKYSKDAELSIPEKVLKPKIIEKEIIKEVIKKAPIQENKEFIDFRNIQVKQEKKIESPIIKREKEKSQFKSIVSNFFLKGKNKTTILDKIAGIK